jgi:hypothetical protein
VEAPVGIERANEIGRRRSMVMVATGVELMIDTPTRRVLG